MFLNDAIDRHGKIVTYINVPINSTRELIVRVWNCVYLYSFFSRRITTTTTTTTLPARPSDNGRLQQHVVVIIKLDSFHHGAV